MQWKSADEMRNLLDLAVILPTYPEREKVNDLICRLGMEQTGYRWEFASRRTSEVIAGEPKG